MSRTPTRLLLAASLLVAVAPTLFAQGGKTTAPIRIAVFTATAPADQFADPEERQRVDSVKDLRAMLLDRRRIKVVDRDEQPDVLIEVLQRDRKADGGSVATAAPFFGGAIATARPTQKAVVRVRLSVVGRDYTTEITGTGGPWRAAARDAAKTIETWVKDNLDKLRATSEKK
jgi:hypothetical protein